MSKAMRLARAKEFIYEERNLILEFPATALVNFADAEYGEALKVCTDTIKAYHDENESLTAALAEARDLLKEMMDWHNVDIDNPDCPAVCVVNPCEWCVKAKAAIEAAGDKG